MAMTRYAKKSKAIIRPVRKTPAPRAVISRVVKAAIETHKQMVANELSQAEHWITCLKLDVDHRDDELRILQKMVDELNAELLEEMGVSSVYRNKLEALGIVDGECRD
jgi:hypothetical protein